ncbi:MAG: MraY family glycosyltransferase [Planctomycetota bacterium]|nr:MraY family glycosyltransferase [Planctomycetota bacterium]
MIYQLIALSGSFALSLLLTPIFRRVSIAIGMVDHPDSHRKLHREPIALCGGPTILVSSLVAACLIPFFDEPIRNVFWFNPWPILGLFGGAIAIVVLGAIDDKFALRGRQKLFGQIAVCFWMVFCGYRISNVELFGLHIDMAILMVPVSILWLLMTINSLNLIDGADGLCSSVGWIASAGIAVIATLIGQTLEATIAAGLAGALLGFLVYNFPPAKVFLGDSGSMLVGLILGALAIRASLKGPTSVSLLAPVAIFAIPFFDSGIAILRRKLTGRSIFSTDRGHIHHSMLRWGLSNQGLVIAITIGCGITAIGAIFSTSMGNPAIAIISVMCVLGALVASRAFGHAELQLLGRRTYHFCGSLVPKSKSDHAVGNYHAIRFQGNRGWETVWNSLMEFAEKHDLAKVSLDLNVPWLHEGFHASWSRTRTPDEANLWKSQLPVFANNRPLGKMILVGRMENVNAVSVLNELAEMMEGLQSVLRELASEPEIHNDSKATLANEATVSTTLDDSVDGALMLPKVASMKSENSSLSS